MYVFNEPFIYFYLSVCPQVETVGYMEFLSGVLHAGYLNASSGKAGFAHAKQAKSPVHCF